MKKLLFIMTMTLYSTLSFASIGLPYPGGNSGQDIIYPRESFLPNTNQPQSQPIPPTTITPHSSPLSYDVNSVIQQIIVSALSNTTRQQFQPHQAHPQPKHKYDDSYLRADATTLEKFKQRGTVPTISTAVEQEIAARQQKIQTTPCAQTLASLVACFDEDEAFWKLRDIYVNMGCEERVNNIQAQDTCYSVPYGLTKDFYTAEHDTKSIANCVAEGSVVGAALLTSARPIVMCSINYTGANYTVRLIKNYHQDKEETNALKLVREAAEKYADDLQYALNSIANIKTAEIALIKPIYYSMCYGYEHDDYAKVVTIVDTQSKQHVFVVSDNAIKSVFQISDGTKHIHSLISYPYLVPQSIIDALIIAQQPTGS